MIDLTQLRIEAEDNSPSISFNNISKLKQTHGDIIACIHCIDSQDDETTQFIFFDGYVHECNGLSLKYDSEDKYQDFMTLALILQSIPCLASSVQKLMAEYAMFNNDNKKSNFFVFRTGTVYMPPSNIYMDCDGMRTLDEIISYLFEDKDNEIHEGES